MCILEKHFMVLSNLVFTSHFFERCCRGEGLRTTTSLKTVDGGKQGHAPCKIFLL